MAEPMTAEQVTDKDSDSLGRRFARARRESGLTQEGIAKHLGWKVQSTISALERGGAKTYLSQLDRWAAVLGKRIVLVDIDQPATEEADRV